VVFSAAWTYSQKKYLGWDNSSIYPAKAGKIITTPKFIEKKFK